MEISAGPVVDAPACTAIKYSGFITRTDVDRLRIAVSDDGIVSLPSAFVMFSTIGAAVESVCFGDDDFTDFTDLAIVELNAGQDGHMRGRVLLGANLAGCFQGNARFLHGKLIRQG